MGQIISTGGLGLLFSIGVAIPLVAGFAFVGFIRLLIFGIELHMIARQRIARAAYASAVISTTLIVALFLILLSTWLASIAARSAFTAPVFLAVLLVAGSMGSVGYRYRTKIEYAMERSGWGSPYIALFVAMIAEVQVTLFSNVLAFWTIPTMLSAAFCTLLAFNFLYESANGARTRRLVDSALALAATISTLMLGAVLLS